MSVNLSKELRKKYGKRNFPAIKGDEIRIMRGEFKNRISKITDVDLKNMKIIIDGIYRTKKDGTKIQVEFEPSNLQIKNLELNDKKRKLALERKSSPEKKIEVKTKPLPKSKKQKEENRSQDAHK